MGIDGKEMNGAGESVNFVYIPRGKKSLIKYPLGSTELMLHASVQRGCCWQFYCCTSDCVIYT